MSVVVLLGAGASVEAGVPDTRRMTTEIRDVLEKLHQRSLAEVISFVAGGLMFRAGVAGGDPFAGVDVEEVLNAISLLAERDQIEASPFIGSWHPRVDELDAEAADADSEIRQLEHDLMELLGHVQEGARRDRYFWTHHPRSGAFFRAFKDAVWAIARGGSRGTIFRKTADAMISALVRIVWLEDAQRVTYLQPLLQLAAPENLCIATLNYDNAMELTAQSSSVNVTSALETWTKTGTFDRAARHVLLLKLHGSIDWAAREQPFSIERPLRTWTVEQATAEAMRGWRYRPAIVFGGREKLTAEGPFLDLLRAFAEELRRASALVVIGYSFRDAHVNEYISRWINDGADRRLIIVDPAFGHSRVAFAERLRATCRSRLDVMPIGASEAIPRLADELAKRP